MREVAKTCVRSLQFAQKYVLLHIDNLLKVSDVSPSQQRGQDHLSDSINLP